MINIGDWVLLKPRDEFNASLYERFLALVPNEPYEVIAVFYPLEYKTDVRAYKIKVRECAEDKWLTFSQFEKIENHNLVKGGEFFD